MIRRAALPVFALLCLVVAAATVNAARRLDDPLPASPAAVLPEVVMVERAVTRVVTATRTPRPTPAPSWTPQPTVPPVTRTAMFATPASEERGDDG